MYYFVTVLQKKKENERSRGDLNVRREEMSKSLKTFQPSVFLRSPRLLSPRCLLSV